MAPVRVIPRIDTRCHTEDRMGGGLDLGELRHGPAAAWPRWNAVAVTMKQRGPSPKPARLTFAQQFQSQARTARDPGSGRFGRALDCEEKAVERTPQQAALLPTREGA